jgi:hypothetical protein
MPRQVSRKRETIRARATATFIALKAGLLTLDGPDYSGAISVHRLDADRQRHAGDGRTRLDWAVLRTALPEVLLRSRRNAHKGTYGTLGVVGGSDGMVGASLLAARAALTWARAKCSWASPRPIDRRSIGSSPS